MGKTTMVKYLSVWLSIAVIFTGCSSTTYSRDYSGLTTPDGAPVAHVTTSNIALHLLVGKQPIAGDASLERTVADFTSAAKASGAAKVRIVQASRTNWWFVLFPFSLLITPVTSNVSGDALK